MAGTIQVRAVLVTAIMARAAAKSTISALASSAIVRGVKASSDTTIRINGSQSMSVSTAITFFRGEDITLNFQLSPPSDITGWTLSFKLADKLGGTVQFTKTPTISDGPRGKFTVAIANADTSALTVGRYVWDCRRTDSGNKTTLADGTLDLKQEVTA